MYPVVVDIIGSSSSKFHLIRLVELLLQVQTTKSMKVRVPIARGNTLGVKRGVGNLC